MENFSSEKHLSGKRLSGKVIIWARINWKSLAVIYTLLHYRHLFHCGCWENCWLHTQMPSCIKRQIHDESQMLDNPTVWLGQHEIHTSIIIIEQR